MTSTLFRTRPAEFIRQNERFYTRVHPTLPQLSNIETARTSDLQNSTNIAIGNKRQTL
jgi:hypothetical protein